MYMCVCNALTDRALKQAASSLATASLGQVYAACGCHLQCGKCVRAVAKLLSEHMGQTAHELHEVD
jgi:bacterioferritin-associated ferredoxin